MQVFDTQGIENDFRKQHADSSLYTDAFWLDDAMIAPSYRSKGYFNIMLESLLKKLEKKGIKYLCIYTTKQETLIQKYQKR